LKKEKWGVDFKMERKRRGGDLSLARHEGESTHTPPTNRG